MGKNNDASSGIGTDLRILTSSVDALVTPIPTLMLLPDTFASVIPMTVVVVAEGTT